VRRDKMPNYYLKLWDDDDREFILPFPVAGPNGKTRKPKKPVALKETWFQKGIRPLKEAICKSEK